MFLKVDINYNQNFNYKVIDKLLCSDQYQCRSQSAKKTTDQKKLRQICVNLCLYFLHSHILK